MEGCHCILAAVSVLVVFLLAKAWRTILWRPLRIQKHFRAQGIRGPPYHLFYGNVREIKKQVEEAKAKPMALSHDILPRVSPFYSHCLNNYGRVFVDWFGWNPRLNITDPELIREILSTKSAHYDKAPLPAFLSQFTGDGLTTSVGKKWEKHRRIINRAFHVEQLKGMIPSVADCAYDMLERWSMAVGQSHTKEMDVSKEFHDLAADIISRTSFGSSYVKGKHIFDAQSEQMFLAVEASRSIYVPGYRFVPTKRNLRLWQLDREVKSALRQMIEGREQSVRMGSSEGYGRDLLGLMMTADKMEQGGNPQNSGMTVEDIIDECKVFFSAGHDTISSILTWTMIVLAMYPDWQERLRNEVLEVCGREVPNAETINRLKLVPMVLNEVLRLYTPAFVVPRYTHTEMKLGSLTIPPHTELLLGVLAVHHDPELWGEDVHEFKPERFAEGAAKAAKHPLAFMPFGMGPRICVGQNFAMQEAKVAVPMILQRYSFSLSPSYAHAPVPVISLHPQHGAQILLQKL